MLVIRNLFCVKHILFYIHYIYMIYIHTSVEIVLSRYGIDWSCIDWSFATPRSHASSSRHSIVITVRYIMFGTQHHTFKPRLPGDVHNVAWINIILNSIYPHTFQHTLDMFGWTSQAQRRRAVVVPCLCHKFGGVCSILPSNLWTMVQKIIYIILYCCWCWCCLLWLLVLSM